MCPCARAHLVPLCVFVYAVGSATLLRGWAVVFLSEGGKLAVMGLYPAKGEEGGVMRSLSRSLSAGGMADKQL